MAIELYKHNKKAYSNVLEHFETTNRTCVVHATGTGKSFISLKWLEDNKDRRCLFLAPTNAIIDQFKTHIEDNGLSLSDFPNLEFELYTNVNNRIADNKYDCIVMDEFHRCGAKEWSKGINKLLDNNEDAKVLGLSATPIRYLDDNRNMADEIFNGNIASEISIAEAIAMGILQAPTYITSIYSFDNEIDKIQNQIDKYKNKEEKKELQKKLDEAKNMLEKSRGLSEVFEKYIKNDKGKYIVFCKDKPHMELMEEKSNEWFKNINKIKVNDVYYEKGRELNKYEIDSFENNERDELKLLFAIEMLNEGVHVKSIDGVIMFRPTVSPIIYFQQLGRALSVGHNEHPIVFDVVNNYECLDQIHTLKDEVEKIIDKAIDDINNGIVPFDGYVDVDSYKFKNILNGFNIIDCNTDIKQILDKLDVDSQFTFEDWYKLAKAYSESHNGSLEVPSRFKTFDGVNEITEDDPRYKDAPNLGAKVVDWRGIYNGTRKGALTQEQIDLLTGIGMRWEKLEKMTFEDWYKLAKAYSESHNGSLEIPKPFKTFDGVNEITEDDPRYKDAPDLRAKVVNWRSIYNGTQKGTLTQEQIDLLTGIGMRLEKLEKMTFEGWYKLAKAYSESHNGSLEIPKRFKTFDGVNEITEDDPRYKDAPALGAKVVDWRGIYNGTQKGTLTQEQIDLLTRIGMRWEKLEKMTFEDWYKLAKAYSESHNSSLEIPKHFKTFDGVNEITEDDPRYKDAPDLGAKVVNWRGIYNGTRNGTLTQEQIDLLIRIGMRLEKLEKMTFEDWYKLAKAYSEHHNGSLEIPNHFKTFDGVNEITEDDPRYKDAPDLGAKVVNWRGIYNGTSNGTLTQEQIDLLIGIGMRFENKKISFEDWYKLAKAYSESHNGSLEIPKPFKTFDGVNEITEDDPRYKNAPDLGAKIVNWRGAYNGTTNGILTFERIKMLEDIGIVWFTDKNNDKLQSQIIDEKNKLKKQKEILNRFNSLLNNYDGESLPSKEDMNDDFIDQLNRKK